MMLDNKIAKEKLPWLFVNWWRWRELNPRPQIER